MAEANNKPLTIPETGGLDATFVSQLGSVIANAETSGGLKVASVNIWDVSGGASSGTLEWSNNSAASASWKAAFDEIAAAAVSTPPPTSDTLKLYMSEDAWKGDAQFVVRMDGTQIGGTQTASAIHATGDDNVFTLTGNWGRAGHDVQIQFLNDAYGGTQATDRNLYVNAIAYDGTTYAGTSAAMLAAGSRDFAVSGAAASSIPPVDTLTLHLSEDAYQGNANFKLTIDSKQITAAEPVTVLHNAGTWEDLAFAGNFGAGMHKIGITFTNVLNAGTPSTDRNLYVNGIDLNGAHYGSAVAVLMATGNTATLQRHHDALSGV